MNLVVPTEGMLIRVCVGFNHDRNINGKLRYNFNRRITVKVFVVDINDCLLNSRKNYVHINTVF
jgi:hypothetical protein